MTEGREGRRETQGQVTATLADVSCHLTQRQPWTLEVAYYRVHHPECVMEGVSCQYPP
jgi:hypothetical protein